MNVTSQLRSSHFAGNSIEPVLIPRLATAPGLPPLAWPVPALARSSRLARVAALAALCAFVGPVRARAAEAGGAAASVDESKVPAAAAGTMDFGRDIEPLLTGHCLKCHGADRPKGGFRVDTREAMLRGGDGGVSVIPGAGAKSALIHYVARLVPDMEMPPTGKGEPLTAAEVGRLRAWIDQGAPWGGNAPSATVAEAAPTVRWITVDGREAKFRELEWMRDGWDGGLESFRVQQQLGPDRRVTVEGRVLRDDYRVTLSVRESDHLYLNAGFEQFRKWYDDQGGYYRPFTPAVTALDRELFLDWGRAWVEAGGTLPGGLQLLGGYEFQFKDGEKAMTQWLPSTQTLPGGDVTRSVLPVTKGVDEQVHLVKLEGAIDWPTVRVEDRFRFERYDLQTRTTSVLDAFPSTFFTQRARGREQLDTLANAVWAETAPREWLLFSAGHLYRHTDGETAFQQRPVDASGNPGQGLLWNARGVPLEQSAHVFNANAQAGPWEGLTGTAGVQAEWNRQESFGRVSLDETDIFDPSLVVTNPATMRGDYDRFTLQENAGARYTGIPWTVVYGEARWQQESIQQFESQETAGGAGHEDFLRDTDATYNWQQYRAGFTVSPWSRVSMNAYAQYRDRDDTFDHDRDERPVGGGGNGYPAFITARETETGEVGTRLVVRPTSWLKTTVGYRVVATEFRTRTDAAVGLDPTPGGWQYAGDTDAHIYTFNASMTPWRRLYLTATLAWQDTRTVARDHFSGAVAPFDGDVYSVLASASYVLSDPTDVHLAYDFSRGDYTQRNEAAGLPLGIDYQRHGLRTGLSHRFLKRFVARAEYAWFLYEEPSSGGFGDYSAHGIFATLNMRWQ